MSEDRPWRALLAAMILDALRRAQRGNTEAAWWLDTIGCDLAGVLGVKIANWRQARVVHKIGRQTNEKRLSTSAAAVYTREYRRRKVA
jgi:hypothetical protein